MIAWWAINQVTTRNDASLSRLAIILPVVGVIISGFFAGLFTLLGKRRESRLGEIYEAFDERGKLVIALRETIEQQTATIAQQKQSIDTAQQANESLRAAMEELHQKYLAEIADLTEKVHELEHEVTETQEMVGIPPKRARRKGGTEA